MENEALTQETAAAAFAELAGDSKPETHEPEQESEETEAESVESPTGQYEQETGDEQQDESSDEPSTEDVSEPELRDPASVAQMEVPDLTVLTPEDWQVVDQQNPYEAAALRGIANWQYEVRLIPEWKNVSTRNAQRRELMNWARTKYGYTDADIQNFDANPDARTLKAHYDLWRAERRPSAVPSQNTRPAKQRTPKEKAWADAEKKMRTARPAEKMEAIVNMMKVHGQHGPMRKPKPTFDGAMKKLEQSGSRRDAAEAFGLLGGKKR